MPSPLTATLKHKIQKGRFAPFHLNETQALKKPNCLKHISTENIAVKSQQQNFGEKLSCYSEALQGKEETSASSVLLLNSLLSIV